MKNKMLMILKIIAVLAFIALLLLCGLAIDPNKAIKEKINNLEKAKEATIEIYSNLIPDNKIVNITEDEDIDELAKIFKNIKVSKFINIGGQNDYYIPKISFYDSSKDKIIEISIYNSGVTVEGKAVDISSKDKNRAREIIKKYIGDNIYGKITCHNEIETDFYYLYDSNIVKYIRVTEDLIENANIDKLKENVTESENISNYSAFLLYDGREYGQFSDEIITLQEGQYYYSETYLIPEMKEQDLKALLNKSKSDFENITVEDIESTYKDGSCEHSLW